MNLAIYDLVFFSFALVLFLVVLAYRWQASRSGSSTWLDRWHHLGALSDADLLAREAAIMERQRLGDDSQWRELIAISAEKWQRGL